MEQLDEEHFELFGVYPNNIGMFQDQEKLMDEIIEAIEKGVPYDQYELLSAEEQEQYDNGTLFF